jgi:hypothetical protein
MYRWHHRSSLSHLKHTDKHHWVLCLSQADAVTKTESELYDIHLLAPPQPLCRI